MSHPTARSNPVWLPLTLLPFALFLMSACRRENNPAPATVSRPAAASTVAPAAAPEGLRDVSERDARYMIGISYPPVANRYPGLAAELKKYADAAHAEMMQAVQGLGQEKPSAPYDLSLQFTQIASTPELIAIAADGSSYTGGAHENPLIARFVWLTKEDKPLPITALIQDPKSWRDLSDHVREQLEAALSQRVDADELSPAERAEVVKNASRMIEEGTKPDVVNFEQFEPVLTPQGRISALRFVFPPYQVGPYADGTQTVDVPADVLMPMIAPAYRHLFVGG